MVTASAQTGLSPSDNAVFFRKSAFLKFYIFSMVVITHALNYESYGLETATGFAEKLLYFLEFSELTLSGVVMPMYFFISAYGFMADYSPDKTLKKWERRFYSLFIPWLLWNTIMWLFSIALEKLPFVASRLNSGFGFELTLRSWIVDGLLRPANGPFWFISNLLVVFLLAPLIFYIVRNRYLGLAVIAAEFVAVLFLDSSRYSLLMSFLFSTQAAYYAMHLRQLVEKDYGKGAKPAALAVLILYMVFCPGKEVQDGGILHALTFSVTTPALWVLVGNASLGPRAAAMEKYRFWIYGSHYLPLECLEKLWLIVGGASVGAAWAGMFLCPVLAVLLLTACGWLVKKYCNPLWCLLCGIRIKKRPPSAATV